MVSKADFFTDENGVKVASEEYAHIDMYLQFLEAVSRITYNSIYLIDCFKKNFLHVSKNSLSLCGRTAGEVKNMGYKFYLQNLADEDRVLLREINKIGPAFIQSVQPESRLEYSLSCDLRLKQPSGQPILLHHEITPLRLSTNGEIWLVLCMVSLSSETKSGNIEIIKQGHNSRWSYDLETKKWVQSTLIKLSDYEKDILVLSAQGCTMEEISNKIHKSIDTVKWYKRILFEKLNVRNITEAIGFATLHKLI